MAQIGTVRLETQNSGAVDVPVFEPGDSASGIYEFVRVETASGPGFIPVTDPVDATYPYLRVQSQNNGIVAVTDTAGSDIPDSEANQKLTHRWYLSENSDPFVDQIGGVDGTNNGTTQVTGSQYVDNAAREGDGTDTITTASSIPDVASDFAIAVTLNNFTSSNRSGIIGESQSTGRLLTLTSFNTAGDVAFDVTDGDSDTVRVRTSSGGLVDDGGRYRLVFNKTGPTASEFEIWITGSEQSVTVDGEQGDGANTPIGSTNDSYFFAEGGGNNKLPAVLDDISFFDSSLTQSEIQSYQLP